MAFVSEELQKLGAKVTVADCREKTLEALTERFDDVVFLDQDSDWCFDRKFDIVLHWGVLYHLNNWQHDLYRVKKHLMHDDSLLLLEAEVIDSEDCEFEIKVLEDPIIWDQSLSGIGTRTSASRIEHCLFDLDMAWARLDENKLNVGQVHTYDWKHDPMTTIGKPDHADRNLYSKGQFKEGLRRFWIVLK